MKRIPIWLIALLTSVGFLAGCGESECPLTTTSVAKFSFLDSRTHAPVAFNQGVMVTGITETDNVLDIDTVFNLAKEYMSVPFSYTDKTVFVLHYTDVMRDTIEVKHRNIPFMDDIECGAMMFYEVESFRYTTYALDSVTLVNSRITNEERNNFNIYYRVDDAE